jgi:hypothetical protein
MSIIAGDCHAYEKPDDSQLIANYPVFLCCVARFAEKGQLRLFWKAWMLHLEEGAFS